MLNIYLIPQFVNLCKKIKNFKILFKKMDKNYLIDFDDI